MVLDSIKKRFLKSDEKYEVLYYKYSQIKIENKNLKKKQEEEIKNLKNSFYKMTAKNLINLYFEIENTKNQSFKVKTTDKEIQRLLINLNSAEKNIKDLMKNYFIEEIQVSERFYDPNLHEIASYQESNGMKKGIIIKTIKKGFKFKDIIIKKPRVVVTK